jgi:hypothetical protein
LFVLFLIIDKNLGMNNQFMVHTTRDGLVMEILLRAKKIYNKRLLWLPLMEILSAAVSQWQVHVWSSSSTVFPLQNNVNLLMNYLSYTVILNLHIFILPNIVYRTKSKMILHCCQQYNPLISILFANGKKTCSKQILIWSWIPISIKKSR